MLCATRDRTTTFEFLLLLSLLLLIFIIYYFFYSYDVLLICLWLLDVYKYNIITLTRMRKTMKHNLSVKLRSPFLV